MPHSVLLDYFKQAPKEGSNFVQKWAAISLIKYLILNRNKILPELSEWLKNNQEKLSEEEFREFYLRRNIYHQGLNRLRDIVIT
ncbi:hypothetical protein AVEN_217015-1 [Araneus ventricosus]|uniref:Uncharacterized protein n=1 Tax=Araneus ventricosus TaxID=182803 RepID=A0A4Y2SSD5_ARAVE|nr:hypothetical protein AVEN_217015-1 [Araneus ventricosus]